MPSAFASAATNAGSPTSWAPPPGLSHKWRACLATEACLSLAGAPGAGGSLQARPCAAVGTAFPRGLMQ
eukprot:9377101-Pyramimonas_sp.AAC.1